MWYKYPMDTNAPPPRYDVLRADCPARQILDRLADKWTILVVLALAPGTLRFSRLKAKVEGISQKMLTQTLRRLERDGMVSRTVYATVPATVEYRLTDLGASLVDAFKVVRRWSHGHIDAIEAARQAYDAAEDRQPNTVY
ncbi:MAG: HxlR family transcriptional regulator [Rhizorhabdus sp.]|nr:HxlR family transcriptional regulator [Rhizorhabdus sp.]